jgi:FrmR/RcnR family transcriptional regulator, repressor of frmRAB operon
MTIAMGALVGTDMKTVMTARQRLARYSRGTEVLQISRKKAKIANRIRRILGQIDALERGVTYGRGCSDSLQLLSAIRGALDGVMREVIEQHVRTNVVKPQSSVAITEAGEELIDIVYSYLK